MQISKMSIKEAIEILSNIDVDVQNTDSAKVAEAIKVAVDCMKTFDAGIEVIRFNG